MGLVTVVMAEEIILKCANLKITTNEKAIVSFDDSIDVSVGLNISMSIVGRVLLKSPITLRHSNEL